MSFREKYSPRSIKKRFQGMQPYLRTMYLLNSITFIAATVYGMYYGVFLYKQTFSLSTLALDGLFSGFGTWIGYLVGVVVIQRLGYKSCFKIAIVGWMTISFVTVLISSHIAEWFIVLAVLRAIPNGMYIANCDTIMLREVMHKQRSGFLQLKMAFEFMTGVVLPPVIGLVLGLEGGYQWIFGIAGSIYLIALFVPIVNNKHDLHLSIKEMIRTFKRPHYKLHAFNRTTAAGFNQLNGFVIMILPFLLLKSELKMGLLTSLTAFCAGIVALLMRNVKPHKSLGIGYMAFGIRSVTSLVFVMIWTAPFMLVWQLVSKLVTPMHDPLQQSLEVHNDSLIMGKDVANKALNINVLNFTLWFLGATFAYGGFYVITRAASGQQQILLQAIILTYTAWRVVGLAVASLINRNARPADSVHTTLNETPPLLEVARLICLGFITRFRVFLST